jgi:hypothetical protein
VTSADVRDVIEWARRLGCRVALAKSGHYRVTYRGRLVGTISGTPSDRRSLLNDKSLIRRNLRALKVKTARP